MDKQPQNFFLTKHFWAIFITFYISSLSPAIEKIINNKLSTQDIINITNSLVVAFGGACLKLLDKDVYTSKFLPGRDKEVATNNCNSFIASIKEDKYLISNEVETVLDDTLDTNINSINSINTPTTTTTTRKARVK